MKSNEPCDYCVDRKHPNCAKGRTAYFPICFKGKQLQAAQKADEPGQNAPAIPPAQNVKTPPGKDATILIKSVVACLADCGTGMSDSTVEDCIGMLRKAIDIIGSP